MAQLNFTKVGILGAGLMGHGIAQLLGVAGVPSRLYDNDAAMLASAPERIQRNLATFSDLGLVAPADAEAAVGRVTLCQSLEEMCQGCDLVIEAVAENLALKQKLFAAMEACTPPETVLASNTSAISIGKIARDLTRPGQVLGTHFWNPPHVVPCVEVIRHDRTDDAVFERVYQFMRQVGKRPVKVLKDVPGFLGNRMQHALWREAISLVAKGIASPQDVDDVVRYSFGLRLAFLGPLATADLAGLDLARDVHADLLPDLDCSEGPSPALLERVEQGQLGAKTG